MASNKLENEINDLYALTSRLSAQNCKDEGYIEIVDPVPKHSINDINSAPPIAPLVTPQQHPAAPLVDPPRRPSASIPSPGFLSLTFSFVGTMTRSYFAGTLFFLIFASLLINGLIEERQINEGLAVVTIVALIWIFFAALIKRWRETGQSMWWLLTLLLPYAQYATMLFAIFAPPKDAA